MATYYKVAETNSSDYEGGEVLARCEARDRRQAERKLGVDGGNAHLYEVIVESKLPENVYDPKLLAIR